MGDCQLRSREGQSRHMYLVMLAYSRLMSQLKQSHAYEWAYRKLTTIGEACRAIGRETLRSTLSWAIERVLVYDWDKVVEANGIANVSLTKPLLEAGSLLGAGAPLRGSGGPGLSGPLNNLLLQKLANPAGGLILDSWVDANGAAQGDAANYIEF